jgi:hypothetical protein
MGIRIATDDRGIKVWRSDRGQYPSYAVQVSKKEGDAWINEYQKIHFKGGADIPNGTVIHIQDAFPALESWVKDGQQYKRIVWIIMEWSDGVAPYQAKSQAPAQGSFDDLPDSFQAAEDEIPFK